MAGKLDGEHVRVMSAGRAFRTATLLARCIAPWLFTWVTMMTASLRETTATSSSLRRPPTRPRWNSTVWPI